MPVERGGQRPRAITLTLARLLVVAALAVGLLPLAPGSPAAADDHSGVTVVAAPDNAGLVREGTMLSVRVTVRNDTEARVEAGEAVLSIDGEQASNATALEAWFSGEEDSAPERVIARATVPALEPGGVAVLDLATGTTTAGFSDQAGPRRALVEHVSGDTVLGSMPTAVVWLPSGSPLPSASSALIVPLSTPGIGDALLTTPQLEEFTAPGGALSRTLDAVEGHGVTLAIDPRILASIRVLGDDAPTSARAFLARLEGLSNESFALTWADADPGLPLVAGDASVTAPTLLPRPDGLLDRDALTLWDHDLAALPWPSPQSITAETVRGLAVENVDGVIAPNELLSGSGPVRGIASTSRSLLVTDSSLSAALNDAAEARSSQIAASAVTRATALLAAAAVEGTTIVAALDRDALDPRRLGAVLDDVSTLPWVQPATVSSLLSRPVGSVATEVGDGSDADLIAAATRALEAEAADIEFSDIAGDPALLVAQRRLELLAALSPGWAPDRVAALDAFVAGSQRLRSSVQVIESSTITLLTDRTSLPISVQNDLPVPVTVYVRVAPETGELRVLDQRVEVTIEPNARAQALVPVQSLTNGTVGITVSLRDAQGQAVGSETVLELNLQAGWETAGTVVIAGVIALLFGFGIVRNVRKRRQKARSRADAPEVSGA